MVAVGSSAQEVLEATRALLPLAREYARQGERERRVPTPVVRAMAEAGICRMFAPRAVGGLELDPVSALDIFYELSRAEGSVGWLAQVYASGSHLPGYMPPEVGRAIWGRDPNAVISSTLAAPTARAVVVEGGYRVSGRWPFGSGCEGGEWHAATVTVWEGDAPRPDASGQPEQRIVILPSADTTVHDTWHVSGLRATGSHDLSAEDVFVPAAWSCWWTDQPYFDGPLYNGARWWLLGHGAQRLGMARAAIDALVELAQVKVPTRAKNLLRDRPLAQMQVAQAEALLESARLLLRDTARQLWERALAGNRLSVREQALGRMANTHAAQVAVSVVDLMYSAAGGTAIYERCPLERLFRDIHAGAQHAAVGLPTFELVGQALLHPDPDALPQPPGPPLL